ncbi:hypothetical protein BDF22DRAFT_718768, partial [Syncephalis plumigaleata]
MKFSAIIAIAVAVVALTGLIKVEASPNRIRRAVVERRAPRAELGTSVGVSASVDASASVGVSASASVEVSGSASVSGSAVVDTNSDT